MQRVVLFLCGVSVVGCTAGAPNASGGATPPAASAAPSATAPANPSNPAAKPANPSSTAGLNRIYKLGRKWEYEMQAGITGAMVNTTMTQEVTGIDGQKATLKVVVTANGVPTESTNTVDLSQPADGAVFSQNVGQGGTWTQSSVTTEKLKVKAGEFDTTRYAGTLKLDGGSSETTFWANDEVGLVKSVTKGSQSLTAYALQQLPPGFQLPAGISGSDANETGSSLIPSTMSYESTMELVSVTP